MYRAFNLNADGTLDKYEMRHLLEALSTEMCTISLEAHRLTFKQWFQRIDVNNTNQVSLTELVDSLCKILGIEKPNGEHPNARLPPKLLNIHKKVQNRSQIKF